MPKQIRDLQNQVQVHMTWIQRESGSVAALMQDLYFVSGCETSPNLSLWDV